MKNDEKTQKPESLYKNSRCVPMENQKLKSVEETSSPNGKWKDSVEFRGYPHMNNSIRPTSFLSMTENEYHNNNVLNLKLLLNSLDPNAPLAFKALLSTTLKVQCC